jgi:hypothetical protein
MMSKHETKVCDRCEAHFECKANNPLQCDCMKVEVSGEEGMLISEEWDDDCLCPACLAEVVAQLRQGQL